MHDSKIYDVIIIGAGPSGITAGVYCARKQMDLIVLTGDIGGQTAWSGNIENYTGYHFISGIELTARFEEHMKTYGIEVRQGEEVIDIKKEKAVITVITARDEYKAKTVIISSGKKSRELNVPGENEFRNRGVTYCATCDGPLFSGKDVVIVGGGNSALDAALQLMKIAKKVYILNIADKLSGDPIMSEKVAAGDNVRVINNAGIKEILGGTLVKSVKIDTPDGEEELFVQGVFVEIGLIPNSSFAGILNKNDLGEIMINSRNETDIDGIFAAGDVTDVPEKQIIIAAGEGAKAALVAFEYLSKRREEWQLRSD